MSERTFAELYCEQHGLTAEAFTDSVLRETLYAQAKLFAPVINLLSARHFAADIEFVHSVGQLRRYREYFVEAEEFASHPENRGILRVALNMRISSRKMRRLVRQTLHANQPAGETEADASSVPFGGVRKNTMELRVRESR